MEKDLSNEERLILITRMIGEAKRQVARGGSFYFLLWGWVVMLCNLGHYVIGVYTNYDHPYVVWLSVIPAAIVSGIYGSKQRSSAGFSSHLDTLYRDIWIAVSVGIAVVLIFMSKLNFNANAIILLLAGIGTFISGRALKFKPLVYGAISLWAAGIIAFNFSEIDQYLVGTIGIFVGYLIPGYLLKRAEK